MSDVRQVTWEASPAVCIQAFQASVRASRLAVFITRNLTACTSSGRFCLWVTMLTVSCVCTTQFQRDKDVVYKCDGTASSIRRSFGPLIPWFSDG